MRSMAAPGSEMLRQSFNPWDTNITAEREYMLLDFPVLAPAMVAGN